jgi:hypothetical protein
LVAISVLFALLAVAVFAQDGGWSNPWKVGFSMKFSTDMFFTGKATGDTENKTTSTPAVATDGTTSTEYGKQSYNKGVTNFFPNRRALPNGPGGDYRMSLSLRNTGENYDMNFNITLDDWMPILGNNYDPGANLINKLINLTHMRDDYGIKGTAGIFSLGLGPWATEAAWVDGNASWGSWLNWGTVNRFGLWVYNGGAITHVSYQDYKHFNHFRTLGTWGEPFSVGVALGDNYKFTLGYMFGYTPDAVGDLKGSKSAINGTFMLSGSPVDMLAFDLFYAVQGQDPDTSTRPVGTGFGYEAPKARWLNNIGAYVQIKGIENLNLSVGYSLWFNAYEAGSYVDQADYNAAIAAGVLPATKAQSVTYQTPVTSGIDLRVGYSGIDKIGLKWNNNISFAGIKGTEFDEYKYSSTVVTGWSGTDALGKGTADWFNWCSTLRADLGFIEGVGLEVAIGSNLGVASATSEDSITLGTTTTANKGSSKQTLHDLQASVGLKYGVGNVSLGLALVFAAELKSSESENTRTTTTGATTTTVQTNRKTTDNKVMFGIPIYFQVSF